MAKSTLYYRLLLFIEQQHSTAPADGGGAVSEPAKATTRKSTTKS